MEVKNRLAPWDRVLPDGEVHPIPAAIALIARRDQILLVKRANSPDAGIWGFPGGKLEFGETVLACAARELREETGVDAEPLKVVTTLDVFVRAPEGVVEKHYVLIAVLCRYTQGNPKGADDALEARWFTLSELEGSAVALSKDVLTLARTVLSDSSPTASTR